MFERLCALWDSGRLTSAQVDRAAARGWITEAEAEQIKAREVAA